MGTAVGEHDGGLIVAVKEIEHVGGERGVEVGAPQGAVVVGVLDDGPRVAYQGGVDAELLGDRLRASIAAARAEYRPESRPGAARATAALVRGRTAPSRSPKSVPSTSRARIRYRRCGHDPQSRSDFLLAIVSRRVPHRESHG